MDAAKEKMEFSCPFEYAATFTEVMFLGNVALCDGEKVYYDGANMYVTSVLAANAFLRRGYRLGWSI